MPRPANLSNNNKKKYFSDRIHFYNYNIYEEKSKNAIANLFDSEDVIIITQRNIYSIYSDFLSSYKHKILFIENKNIKELPSILNNLIALGANKNTLLVGFGGGEVTDVVAFIASVYMRGIQCNLVPTTLLAMVDASIGGKNSMNIGNIKNSIGSIKQADKIYINTWFLETLPKIEMQNGFVEIFKIALLCDENLLKLLITNWNNIYNKHNNKLLMEIIKKSVDLKLQIVEEDEFDIGIRNILNFGHTVGHLLELEYNISHGHAVAIGIYYESQIAKKMGLTSSQVCEKVYNLLQILELDFNKYSIYSIKNKSQNIFFDKKIHEDTINFTYLESIGVSKLIKLKINDFLLYI